MIIRHIIRPRRRMMKSKKKDRYMVIDNDEIDFLCTEIDKKILTRLGASKRLISGIWYNGICFDPDGTCGRVVRGLFPPGIEDQGNMKPSHHRQDDNPFPDPIQAYLFGRTRAIFRMVEYNPLVGLYPPDDMNKKERRKAALVVEGFRAWFANR
jgi:hypothetical protein